MNYYSKNLNDFISHNNFSLKGLTSSEVSLSQKKHGKNELTKVKPRSLFRRICDALLEPMLIILEIAGAITLGVNLGKFVKTGSGDFYECIGILISIAISVALTIYMEGRSRKAFEMLSSVYQNATVKVLRNGETVLISQKDLAVGDLCYLQAGDKVFADGRLVSASGLMVSESNLTGESNPVSKNASAVLNANVPLAERVNMVYSGTFVTEGVGEYIVTAVGDGAEMGVIASDLQETTAVSKPLQEKLDRLGKLVTALGIIASCFVLILNIARLFSAGNVSFSTVQDAFLSSIILIVASVPEGLPTTVAIALTLNVVKLSKSNALIKKLVATETVGCVSVICSDKTGTLTQNEMAVTGFYPYKEDSESKRHAHINFALNTSASWSSSGFIGSPTETALLKYLKKIKFSYKTLKDQAKTQVIVPFSSQNKYMITRVELNSNVVDYVKGAPEVIVSNSNVSPKDKEKLEREIAVFQSEGKRVIAFARQTASGFQNLIFDGFAVISDPVRQDVHFAVTECQNAGIAVKMLTGDSPNTAFSIARELGIAITSSEVVTATFIDGLSDSKLKEILPSIKVVARSEPKTKLRVVTLLKELGEVVAVTGDGVNDAPAVKRADVGIAMGSGSEITKEASDVVLLDDSFSTIVTAISFGRNVYANFQRFIAFQLSVNLSAVAFIIISLLLNLQEPFNTVELLWINIIMDGPPALTLGLETRSNELLSKKPVKRSNDIVTKNMLLKVVINAVYMCALLTLQYKFNFLGVEKAQMKTVMFSMFILLQLFNAFNCRELGSVSVLSNLKSNKPMLIVFLITFVLHVLLSQVFGGFFGTVPLEIGVWFKIIATASSVVVISEIYKFIKRKLNKRQKNRANLKLNLIKKKNIA